MADQEFQILFSSSDFLQLQSRCQDLEIVAKKLNEQKAVLDNQMFQLSQKNLQMQKKITKLEDNIVYLSKQGFKMGQKLIGKDINQQRLEELQKQSIYLKESIKNQAEKQNKELQQKIKLMTQQHDKEKTQLKNEIQKLNQLVRDHRLNQQKYNENAKQFQKVEQRFQKLIQKNTELNGTVNRMKMQLDHLNTRYVQQNSKVLKLQAVIKQKIEENLKIKQNSVTNQYINQQIESKLIIESQLQQKQKQILDYIDRVKGQNKQIKNLEDQIKLLKSQKEKHQKQKKSKKEVALKEIRTLIEEYFSMYMIGLIQSGGLSNQQMDQILKSQQEVILRFIKDSVDIIIKQEKNKSKNSKQIQKKNIDKCKKMQKCFKNRNQFIDQ